MVNPAQNGVLYPKKGVSPNLMGLTVKPGKYHVPGKNNSISQFNNGDEKIANGQCCISQ